MLIGYWSSPRRPARGVSRAKSYLREQRVAFREVDASRDPAAARDLVRRTGQVGVPVMEIDGRPVVGFDRARIDQLLGLRDRAARR